MNPRNMDDPRIDIVPPAWTFQIEISARGRTIDEAWENAIEEFAQDPGGPPDQEGTTEQFRTFQELYFREDQNDL